MTAILHCKETVDFINGKAVYLNNFIHILFGKGPEKGNMTMFSNS